MPIYEYRREDGSTFEIQQRITEDALQNCPTTGQPVKRVISGNAGLIFKGSGFYLTDYGRSGKQAAKAETPAVSSKKSETKATESKSADSKASSS